MFVASDIDETRKMEYAGHWDKIGRRSKGISDPPYEPLQAIGIVPFPEDVAFAYMAYHYRLEGDTSENLCKWNSEVSCWHLGLS